MIFDPKLARTADTWQNRYAIIQRILKHLGYRTNRLDHMQLEELLRVMYWPIERIMDEVVRKD